MVIFLQEDGDDLLLKAEKENRQKVSGILQRMLLLFRAARCSFPVAQWYILQLRWARKVMQKVWKCLSHLCTVKLLKSTNIYSYLQIPTIMTIFQGILSYKGIDFRFAYNKQGCILFYTDFSCAIAASLPDKRPDRTSAHMSLIQMQPLYKLVVCLFEMWK